ncbi:monofunctional biosynthetic peptidoglycan transglycosylase [Rhizorhabdus wittichii]|jgi:monofunctional biosynthetic peptidoglycan transglycosylase|uniref:Biosynthetic peptidoglycan transglycosylase n=1 Tax=Rhizorhabdus wittichii TaxID=160791 RepID=A0A975HFY1_9SPHN|nr:monofunctional biosynthetic peptidoglycan transglycosylase [Rhizorhabdus wittichii]QTH22349.1 monofunctional biosynthetic peptidoglycan transglycosylase [Rhizorhabdus wittichii]
MARESFARRALRWIVRALIIFVIGSVIWVGIYRFVPPPVTTTMIVNAFDGRGIAKDWMSIDTMSPNMALAAIAAEDGNFCSHHGFDFKAIQKAMESNFQGDRRIRGGSTISQQTAKNAFLWQNGGYVRKAFEAWFTVLIELLWPKKRIMEVYLNIAETGIGTYGANAGAMRYFHHDASRLSRAEAARIAAVLPLPKKREAISPTGFTRRYGDRIARRMGQVQRYGQDGCLK